MNKFMRFLVSLLLVIAIIASIGWYLFVYDRDFTRDFLLNQARYNDLYGNARLSSMFYNLAYEHSGRDENVAIELANQYKADGNYTKAELTLSNAIRNNGTVELYTALCRTYVEQDKLLDAVNMLANIPNESLKLALDALRPTAPATNYEPGFYSQYIDVELTSSADTLFYTTDGDYPSISDPVYTGPIEMDAGETMIYAISVDENGLVSPLTIVSYTVGGVIEPAVFMDPVMEDAIREIIGANSSDILYTNEMWDITEFTVPADAMSIDDLKLLPHLRSLTIHGKSLDSLEILSDLTKLQTLDLTDCVFSPEELTVLAGLPNLSDLTLSKCNLSTIASLANAESLTRLNLSGNTVRNLEAISTMTTLRELNLQHNAVTGLEQLSGLNNLEKLDISYNAVTDLKPLSTCVKLNWLDAGNNQLYTLSGVENLTLLSHLSVDYNFLADISLLADCKELTELSISNNQIANLFALTGLAKLDTLNFSYNTVTALPDWAEGCTLRTIDGSHNQLTSIDNLKNLDGIAYIYMDYNQITNVDALADCYHLVQVNVFGNTGIQSVSLLTDHDIIVNYDPT